MEQVLQKQFQAFEGHKVIGNNPHGFTKGREDRARLLGGEEVHTFAVQRHLDIIATEIGLMEKNILNESG